MIWFTSIASAAEAVPAAKAVVETVSAGVAAGLPAAQGLAVASPDYSWILPAGSVLLSALTLLFGWLLSRAVARRADEQKLRDEANEAATIKAAENALAAKVQSEATAHAVDGQSTEVKKLLTELATAKQEVKSLTDERLRKAEEKAPIAPHVIAPGNGGAVDRAADRERLLAEVAKFLADKQP